MIYSKYRKCITLLSSIVIAAGVLVGCNSTQPAVSNKVATTQQQDQDKLNSENKAKEEADLKAKAEAEAKAKAKQEAELTAKLEAETKARKEAEEKARKESEARAQAEAQLRAQQVSSQKAAQVEAEKNTLTVYVTKTGEKYHRDSCRYLSRSKIPISLANAKMSYSPCSVCNPPQ